MARWEREWVQVKTCVHRPASGGSIVLQPHKSFEKLHSLTSVQRREAIEGRVVLLNSLSQVVSPQVVARQVEMVTGHVVEEKCTQTFPCLCIYWRLWSRTKHLQTFMVILLQVLHISLQQNCTCTLYRKYKLHHKLLLSRGNNFQTNGNFLFMEEHVLVIFLLAYSHCLLYWSSL